MLTVTDSAKQELKRKLVAHTNDPEVGVRLTLKLPEQTYGMVADKEAPGDYVVKHEGAEVLLVGPDVAPQVAGRTLDTQDTPNGIALVISKK